MTGRPQERPRRRILFVNPSLEPPGGGAGVAAWMVEALKDHHDVTVLAWEPSDLAAVNRYWATQIRPGQIRTRYLPQPLMRVLGRLPLRLALLRSSLLMRAARRVAHEYDVIVTANNEMDLGKRCIQYVHYPAYLRPRPPADIRWFHVEAMLRGYYAVCDRLSGVSCERVRRNLTLVNSDWTAGRFFERHGVRPETLYPPVTDELPEVPWEARDDGFMAVGRFAPEKELEKVIDILARVGAEAPDVRLHLIGSPGSSTYYRRVMRKARGAGDLVTVKLDLSRDALIRELTSHRYGLHGMVDEHFGMAPAEMVQAGCVVFVPRSGGAREVVGGEERLVYDDPADAVRKIVRVLKDPVEQAALRSRLALERPRFSTRRFVERVRQLVDEFNP